MSKQVIHISRAQALSNFAELLAQVRAGIEVIIEEDSCAFAVLSPASFSLGRRLSEAIASAESRASTATLDGNFATDLNTIIDSHHEPLAPPAWE